VNLGQIKSGSAEGLDRINRESGGRSGIEKGDPKIAVYEKKAIDRSAGG
jgi:hypothetical protein